MNTIALIILFIFGIVCAWGILKASNWLPVILLLLGVGVSEASISVSVSTSSNACTVPPHSAQLYNCGGSLIVSMTSSPQAVSDAYAGASVYVQFADGSSTSCQNMPTAGGSITFYGCGSSPAPPTYYWNYCITNNTGLAMQVMWVGSPANSPLVNLGPGQYYCFNGSGTNWGFGGFTTAYYLPDGTATNISIWPPTSPNGTNASPSNGGGYNPGLNGGNGTAGGGAAGPGAGVAGSNTNLTGNQYYQGITNLQSGLNVGFGYLGSLIGAADTQIQMGNGILLSISNGVLTMIGAEGTNNAQNVGITNALAVMTNQLAALTNGGFSLISSNLGTLNSNTVAGFSNLLAALGGTNSPFPSGTDTNSDQVRSNAGYMSNSVFANWGAPFDYGGATDIISGSSNSYWFLNINTNPFTGSPGGVKGIDLDPRHSAWFTGFASYAKNIEVWVITLAVMWQIRVWMSKRLMAVLMTPGPSVGGGEVSSVAIMIAKAAGGTAIVASLPLMMAAAAYNFFNWPSYTTAAHPLGAAAVYSLAGSVGPYIADAIDIVGYMVPLGFLGGALVYLGVVWLALDAMVVGVMTRVRFYPF